MTVMIDNCNVNVAGGELPEEELRQYVARGREKHRRECGRRVCRAYVSFHDAAFRAHKAHNRVFGGYAGQVQRRETRGGT